MRHAMIVSFSALLVLAGCGGSQDADETLDSIAVSEGATPTVSFDGTVKSSETESKVVKDGSGEPIAEGETIKINYVAVNGRSGDEFDSSYPSGTPATLTLSDQNVLPGFVKALDGKKVGSRVLALIPSEDGFGEARPDFDLKQSDTMVFVFDIVGKVPGQATGEAKKAPADVPQLEVDENDVPVGFKKTDETPDKVTEASSHVIIEGDGPEVKLDQVITAHYFGQIYPDGSVFDQSFAKGSPLTSVLSQGSLIDCWTSQLPGKKVGSRVVLVCPSDTAYGDQGQPPAIQGGDTLVFAIDLLDAS